MSDKLGVQPLPQLADIKPYITGKAPKKTGGRTFKLASNENPLGCSPAAREAAIKAANSLETYPDGVSSGLRETIAEEYGFDPERLICGSGSDEIFQLLSRAYLAPGDEIVQSEYAFQVYRLVAMHAGAKVVDAAEKNLTADVDAMLACVTDRTKIVFLANPNNPTGTYIPFDEVRRLHAGLPSNVLLVLDAAYAEYLRLDDYKSGMELVSEFDNVLMTRTFSKAYGLAALRLGWAYGPAHVIETLNKVRGPFNVNAVAQAAGVAAIKDKEFVDRSVAHNEVELNRLVEGVRKLGLTAHDSVGNFILVRFPQTPGLTADDALAAFGAEGVSVRPMGPYKLPDCLRISIGESDSVDVVLSILSKLVADA